MEGVLQVLVQIVEDGATVLSTADPVTFRGLVVQEAGGAAVGNAFNKEGRILSGCGNL